MKRTRSYRKLGIALVVALGLVALLALPSLAAAKARDRNHDGIPDRWEKRHHLSLKVKQTRRNQDHEGLNNLQEFRHGTNPRRADTDRDRLTDSQEVEVGDDPSDDDSDDDGIEDGDENAGTVASFDGTTLTIALLGGGTLSGRVSESTEIECEQAGSQAGARASHADGEESDDDSPSSSDGTTCTAADLVPGALVHEAELMIEGGEAVFEEVELVS